MLLLSVIWWWHYQFVGWMGQLIKRMCNIWQWPICKHAFFKYFLWQKQGQIKQTVQMNLFSSFFFKNVALVCVEYYETLKWQKPWTGRAQIHRPCPVFSPHREAVEILSMQCPGKRPFLWEPRGRDLCDNVTCEPALYGHDKDSSDSGLHQTDRGSGDKGAALRLIHLFGGAEVWS